MEILARRERRSKTQPDTGGFVRIFSSWKFGKSSAPSYYVPPNNIVMFVPVLMNMIWGLGRLRHGLLAKRAAFGPPKLY